MTGMSFRWIPSNPSLRSSHYLPRSESGFPLPPSPPTWRLRGHLLPPREEYGPLIAIRSGTEKIVIIGRYKAAVDIMEKQGGILADRPRMIAAEELLAGGLTIGFAHAGERFRRMRRALHMHLQPKAVEAYQPLQMSHAKKTVLNILDELYNFLNHTGTIERVLKAMRPGAYLVDSIPWLKYLPWYGRELKRGYESSKRLYIRQLNHVKQQIQSNIDVGPSFAKYVLENGHSYGITEIEAAFLAGAFFSAGSTMTSMATCTVLMAAACFPEEQAKVQAELDSVIGRHRAPTFSDQQSLPHLQAFISEALRWRPLSANGLPHRTTKDVIWGGYCIPAGTTVSGNHWAISRDSEVFPEPHTFKPRRWIDDQGRLRDDLRFFVYGFGRRVCPGEHVANRSIFINSLLIFWAFQLTLDPGALLDDMGYMKGDVQRPCSIQFKTRVPEAELRQMMQKHSESDVA
ncbi:cytochrome P450 [Rhizopogon vinicolor AM-OR11-026]|uniref:Cytochrome P450 n=1 Tax=Rhizopogon vinicolor AM-OR11-026 TaxID=1314800 RepID=A0A1B7MIP7_9AGAM|nr:cytochrome P450 [Rhizopogon vinicolor AM-OR11-026]